MTFSPRPTAGGRVGLRMERDGNVAAMPSTASDVVSTYFDALARRDLEAIAGCWAPEGEEHLARQVDPVTGDVRGQLAAAADG
jgi:hypothetical protein